MTTCFRLISLLCLSIALSVPVTGQAAATSSGKFVADSVRPFTQTQLVELLKREGYGSVRPLGEDNIHFKYDGYDIFLVITKMGGISLFFRMNQIPDFTLNDVNERNASTRLSRVFLDKDGNLVLTNDLLYTDNSNDTPVILFVRSFHVSIKMLINDLIEKRDAIKP